MIENRERQWEEEKRNEVQYLMIVKGEGIRKKGRKEAQYFNDC